MLMWLMSILVLWLILVFFLEKKYVLLLLMYIEGIILLLFFSMVSLVFVMGDFLFMGLFMMLMAAVMAALGLVFLTVLSRKKNSMYLKNWFYV